MRRNFYQLVFLDVFKRFLEGELDGRREYNLLVGSGGAYVGELLGLADVDVQISLSGMFSHNLSCIDVLSRLNEEPAPVEQFVH